MSSVRLVPNGGEVSLTARHALNTLRKYPRWRLVGSSFTRFRYGDGFSHSRALGLQLALATIPLTIAAVGLSSWVHATSVRLVVRDTMLQLTPGASQELVRRTLSPFADESTENIWALVLGLLAAAVSLTTGMGQLQRGANRIYGIQRDRPAVQKYRRAAILAAMAGLPAMAGFAMLVASDAFSDAVENVYGIDDDVAALTTRPIGVVLLLVAIGIMLHHAPHRRQPGWSLLVAGVIVALGSWLALTALLAAFLHISAEVGSVYGPLTGVMALLVWAQLTAGALFLGLAVSAELEMAAGATATGHWLPPDIES